MAKAKVSSKKIEQPALYVAIGYGGDYWGVGTSNDRKDAISNLSYENGALPSVIIEVYAEALVTEPKTIKVTI